MNHIHHDNALAMLRTMPFTAEELTLIEAAAADLPWEQLSPMIQDLQFPATSEAATVATTSKRTAAATAKAHTIRLVKFAIICTVIPLKETVFNAFYGKI